MTYNVFGGTLNLAQFTVSLQSGRTAGSFTALLNTDCSTLQATSDQQNPLAHGFTIFASCYFWHIYVYRFINLDACSQQRMFTGICCVYF